MVVALEMRAQTVNYVAQPVKRRTVLGEVDSCTEPSSIFHTHLSTWLSLCLTHRVITSSALRQDYNFCFEYFLSTLFYNIKIGNAEQMIKRTKPK